VGRLKLRSVAVTAVARELCGFLWELSRLLSDRLPASNQTQPAS